MPSMPRHLYSAVAFTFAEGVAQFGYVCSPVDIVSNDKSARDLYSAIAFTFDECAAQFGYFFFFSH